MDFVTTGGMQVARTLYDFVNAEAIPGTGVEPAVFWQGFGALVRDLAPRNKALLDRRDELQRQIDAWHLEQRGKPIDPGAYRNSCAASAICSRSLPTSRSAPTTSIPRSPASPARNSSCR